MRILKCALTGLQFVFVGLGLLAVFVLGQALWRIDHGGNDIFGVETFRVGSFVRNLLIIFFSGCGYRWAKQADVRAVEREQRERHP